MKRFFTLLAACLICCSMWAVQVDCVAGSLSSIIDDTSITQLTITGTIDARDFKFIARNLNSLEQLDLSNAEIVAYNNEKSPVFLSITTYDAQAIPATAFMSKKLSNVVLPQGLTTIGTAAFAGCNIESIVLPTTLENIEPYAFSSCNNLKSITLPAGLRQLGEGAFARCKSLQEATINPDDSFSVGKDAFLDCTALSSVTIGNNVTAIGPGAFSGCTALASPTISSNSNLTTIAEAAFAASAVENIALNQCNQLTTIGMWAFANTPLQNVTLPESLESLGDGAFYYNLNMEQINLPAAITSLSNYLMAGNNAVDMEQPLHDGVTSIGDYAFYNWDQMRNFTFPQSVEYVGTMAMAGQTSLELVTAHPLTVPALGDSVWAGVNQPSIPLKTDASVTDDYAAAQQWMEFDIQHVSPPTSIDDNHAGNLEVKAHFEGSWLIVNANAVITKISIFDINGVMLSTASPASERAQLSTAIFNGKFYIVNVILEGGTQRSFKLMRH